MSRRTTSIRLAATLIAAAAPVLLQAQRAAAHAHPHAPAPSAILRGIVLRQDSVTPAPYASVEIVDRGMQRLSNDSGAFSFRLAPGRYHLRARQIGFAPHDTVVQVAGGVSAEPVVIRLTALMVRLVDVTVRRPQKCTTPGVDSADRPALYGIVAAVRENALREMLLRRSYPFEYLVEDVQHTHPQSGTAASRTTTDTLGYRSDDWAPYRVGATVFTDRTDPRGAWERMRLPATTDFADAAFIGSHCFDYGLDEAGNYELYFEPLATLSVPDVAGTVTLDTISYVVRAASMRLTQSAAVAQGFKRLEVKVRYAELAPRVAVPVEITATQLYHTPEPDAQAYVATEVQSIRTLRFLHGVPPGVQREQRFAAALPSGGPSAPAGLAP